MGVVRRCENAAAGSVASSSLLMAESNVAILHGPPHSLAWLREALEVTVFVASASGDPAPAPVLTMRPWFAVRGDAPASETPQPNYNSVDTLLVSRAREIQQESEALIKSQFVLQCELAGRLPRVPCALTCISSACGRRLVAAEHVKWSSNTELMHVRQFRIGHDPQARVVHAEYYYAFCCRDPTCSAAVAVALRQVTQAVKEENPGIQAQRACRACKRWDADAAPLKRCTGCAAMWYCSRACQSADWARHRAECKLIKEQALKANTNK
jgi:hypothetical protein